MGACCHLSAMVDHCHSSIVVCYIAVGDVGPASCVNNREGRGTHIAHLAIVHCSWSCVVVIQLLTGHPMVTNNKCVRRLVATSLTVMWHLDSMLDRLVVGVHSDKHEVLSVPHMF